MKSVMELMRELAGVFNVIFNPMSIPGAANVPKQEPPEDADDELKMGK